MKKKIYDIGIIGGGVAGVFAALRLAEKHKNKKAVLIELGRGPGKRRRQLEGWFGCFPTGDGKLYLNDIDKVSNIVDGRRAKSIYRWLNEHLDEVNPTKTIKNKQPSAAIQKKIKSAGFKLETNDYKQWQPESIHQLSKLIAERVEDAGNVEFSFDNEVYEFSKSGKDFIISSADGDFCCRNIILCVGRSSWRWVNKIYKNFGILVQNDYAKFGIRVELAGQYLKDFNKCHCSLIRDDLIIGPISWGGTIIQEDHADLTIAAFRSNENRWKTDKAYFSLIGIRPFKDKGCEETDRLAKLAFLLFGDRVGREKIKLLMNKSSQLMMIPEYLWLIDKIKEINSSIVPTLISRGYYHSPEILPLAADIRLGSNLESEVENLYIAGESANITGIAAAAIMGGVAVESACK